MNRLPSWLLWVSVPAMLAAWLIFGLLDSGPTTAPAAEGQRSPRYSLKGVNWVRLNAQGESEFTAQADTADYFDDESAHYEQLRVEVTGINNQAGATPWKLSSPSGEAPAHEKRISMNGPVDVSGAWPDGQPLTLKTPQLWVDPVQRTLNTEAGVEFASDSRNGQSRGLKADWSKQTVQLLGDVRMEYVQPAR